ncbi:hypothetical protein DSO57_1000451 [Entomophthora muscae]|uniref:Uncharacterized protein n=1 Tax=Entomophthora muscae TaxID=34485 RepID=A0ACC2UV44_9FUNG|nr:hypothetical protein DSO57_1000451 [Entomophthora muscae]
MTNRGREFIGGEFARLLQGWYWPTEGLAPAEVQVYSGDACLVIGKVLEEFALMQAKYKLLINHSPLLENDNSSKLVPGYNPGHTLGIGDQEPHNTLVVAKITPPPANISHNTHGALKVPPHDMTKGIDQSDHNVKLQAPSTN